MNAPPQTTIPLPDRMRDLPRDHRGYIIPRFVHWENGEPDFRIVDAAFRMRCVTYRLCWLCGQKLGRHLAFVIGPMCALTRTTSEPPSHLECARYAAQVCPFLSRPRMRRNEKDWPEDKVRYIPGDHLERNPGVSVIWVTADYGAFAVANGDLYKVGDPISIEWWREGRPAARAECAESIEAGLPLLRDMADRQDATNQLRPDDPRGARYALEQTYITRLDTLLPA